MAIPEEWSTRVKEGSLAVGHALDLLESLTRDSSALSDVGVRLKDADGRRFALGKLKIRRIPCIEEPMAGDKPKSAAVRTEEYEAHEYLEGVAPLSKKLQEQFPGSKFDPKSTALLISQIQQFNEDALGIKSMQPRPFPKLPAKLFQDMRPDGTLHSILSRFQTAMIGRSLKRVDFTNPHHRNKFLDILAMVMHDLLKQGLLQWPRVYIHPSCGGEASSLQSMVSKMRGEVVASPDAPGVTHHIFPFGLRGDPDDGIQYMRNLGRRGDKALVHWWYYPDSYDELVSLDSAPEVIEPDKQPEGVWKVYLRWVKDSIKYNEWMNPIDYEVDDVPPAKDSAPRGQQLAASNATPAANVKRKREDSEAAAGKAAAVDQPQKAAGVRAPLIPAAVRLPEVTAGMEIAPGLVKQQLLQPDPRALRPSASCIDLSQGQGGQRPPAQGQEAGQLPAHASWFRYDATHANEVRGCPLFFRNPATDKTAQYKEVRNTLVDTYRAEPSRRLTFTEARKLVAGDAEEVLQVWRVLDRWGVINSLATDSPAETDSSPIQLYTAGAPAEARVTSAASLEDAEALFRTRRRPTANRGASAAAGSTCSTSEPPRKQLKLGGPTDVPVKEARFFCNATPGVECTQLRYHCTKLPGVDLCPQAYADGRFPAGCTARDFVRIDQSDMQAVSGFWSDQDTLLMLEGLELFGDNWAEIADHVGTKSQVQCITHFLRLPVEDEYLDQLEDAGRQQSAEPRQAERGDAVVPFAEQSSPVMAQVAFLAGVVGPRVAAAAAQRALEVLMEEDEAVVSGEGTHAPDDDKPPSEARVRAAAAAAWEASAAEARLLAGAEEREVRQLLRQAVSVQAKLVDQRMKQFAQLQQALVDERPKLRTQREAATRERTRLQEARQQPVQASANRGAPALHTQLPAAAALSQSAAQQQAVRPVQAASALQLEQPPPG